MRSKFSTPVFFRTSSPKKSAATHVIFPLSWTPSLSGYNPSLTAFSSYALASRMASSARSSPTTSYPNDASVSASYPLPHPGTSAVALFPSGRAGKRSGREVRTSGRAGCGAARSQGVWEVDQRSDQTEPWVSTDLVLKVSWMEALPAAISGDVGGCRGMCGGGFGLSEVVWLDVVYRHWIGAKR